METWEELIRNCTEKECNDYSSIFFKEARKAKEAQDDKNESLFNMLGDITSMYFKLDTAGEPFGPMAQFSGKRTAIPDDFSDEQLERLKTMMPNITDPEMRARIADVIWIRKHDYQMAQIAVASYLESATILEDPNNWTACEERIERALQIGASLGGNNTYFGNVVSYVETVLDKYNGDDPLFLSARLMEHLLDYKQGDPKKYTALAEKIAKKAEVDGDWPRAKSYWEVKARWDKMNKDETGGKTALIQAAETYVKLADTATSGSNPSYMVASSQIQHAIEAYRRIGGMDDRVNELHKILREYQQKSMSEMKVITTKVDLDHARIEEEQQRFINMVKGKNFLTSILEFAKMLSIPKVTQLNEEVKNLAKDYPLQYIIGASKVDESGKVTGRTSSLLSNTTEEQDLAMRAHMFKQAHLDYETQTFFVIEPVRRQIILDHNIRIHDFLPAVSNNPFVPKGREYIFAQGLNAGMEGNFMLMTHLLIPQFENTVRYILENNGVITSGIDDEGIQNDYNLNKTLYLPETKEIFGEDLLFTLQCILVEHNGSNLRNRMAHGLMPLSHFYSSEVEYFWALMLRFVCWHLLVTINKKNTETISKPGE